MSALRARIGHVVSIFIQIIFVFAGLVAITIFVCSYLNTGTKLVADIYPMEFRVPVNGGELAAVARSNQPINPTIAHILAVTNANGFARIELKNDGNRPIDDIHIRVFGADIYVKETPKMGNSIVIPASEATGITVPKLAKGSAIRVYVWSSIIPGSYSSWDALYDQFTITFSQNFADRRFHMTVGAVAEFVDKHFMIIFGVFSMLFLLSIVGLLTWAFRLRQN
jgi:hypothetical protein